MKTILIKYATRGRYDQFMRRLKDIKATAADMENMYIVVTNDKDDGCMMDAVNVAEAYRVGVPLMMRHAEPSNKIAAINAHVNDLTVKWDVLVCMSDDMIPQVQGWDNIIREKAEQIGHTDFFLHYNDGYAKEALCTLSIIGYDYYQRDKYIYNPGYKSVGCDVEAHYVAVMRGCYHYSEQVLFLHHHPANTPFASVDALYYKNEIHEKADHDLYFNRLAIYFGLSLEEIKCPLPINPWDFRHKVTERLPGLRPKLAILIPTIDGREDSLQWLLNELDRQRSSFSGDDIIVIVDKDSQQFPIGTKRNFLEAAARASEATHRCFIDDDDQIAPNYLALNMPGVFRMFDCNSLNGRYFENGQYDRPFIHSLKYDHWFQDEKAYYRNPNHLNVVRLDRIKDIRFPEKSFGEDGVWSERVQEAGVLRNEYEITETFYDYLCVTKSQEYVDKIKQQHESN